MHRFEEDIIGLIKVAPAQIASFRQLISELGAEADQRHEIHQVLQELVKQGRIVPLKGNRFGLPAQQKIVTGRLEVHRDGYGFVTPEEKLLGLAGDIFVAAKHMADSMQGDRVLISLESGRAGNRTEGRVLKVLERGHLCVVGQFKKSSSHNYVFPFDSRLNCEIFVPEGEELNAAPDSIVNVEITRFGRGDLGRRGKVIEVLGFRGDFGVDVEIMIRKHQLPADFPAAVLMEVDRVNREINPEDCRDRTDFRHLPVVTIDGETAKDFDDAIHVEKLGNGNFLLGVHIADVSHYVRRGTALDQEAARRGTSVYFPDRAVPMLPEEFSNGICSLNPKVDRLVLSVLMEINSSGELAGYSFHEGVIRSWERMTYTLVARLLSDHDPEECSRFGRLVPHFQSMYELAQILYDRRRKGGSIDFDLPEPVISFDEMGSMTGIVKTERNMAHRIIEEFMLAANEAVARHLFDCRVPSLFRIHEPPDPLKVAEFNEIAVGFGYCLGVDLPDWRQEAAPRVKDRRGHLQPNRRMREEARKLEALNLRVSSRDYQKLADLLKGKPEERILSFLMLRSLKQASYSPLNKSHFGLASGGYTHFTSPIRRYPDLIVHRILRAHLNSCPAKSWGHVFGPGKKGPAETVGGKRLDQEAAKGLEGSYCAEDLEQIALHSSHTERRADEAERELLELKKLDFMAGKLGEIYEGIVIHITREGMLVELLDLYVEGFVPIGTLMNDEFRFRDRPATLVGRRFGKNYRLGARLQCVVDRVDRYFHRVELAVTEE